jgi:tellurite methyltransferase
MTLQYDKYYETENLFGEPYPELIAFFTDFPTRGKLLDLGCGQGRDAIPLARLGYEVTGIDHSKVGIDQMISRANDEKINVEGHIGNIYEYNKFSRFDFILLDNMFHFNKKDKKNETDFISRIFESAVPETILVICIPDTGNKITILNHTLKSHNIKRISNTSFEYVFKDDQSGHISISGYKMFANIKLK